MLMSKLVAAVCWQGTRVLGEDHWTEAGSVWCARREEGMAAPVVGTAAEHGEHTSGSLRGLTLAALGVAWLRPFADHPIEL